MEIVDERLKGFPVEPGCIMGYAWDLFIETKGEPSLFVPGPRLRHMDLLLRIRITFIKEGWVTSSYGLTDLLGDAVRVELIFSTRKGGI